MILNLRGNLVKKAADYIESFFPDYYGSIAAVLLKNNPFKYQTRVSYNEKINGVLSFYLSSFNNNKAKIKLLAGNNESIELLLAPLKSLSEIKITVPEKLISYIETLKKIGFNEKGKIYSKELDENMTDLILTP